jgi:aryl-phospho-beta-D-glucosidase BglC (GH1 family)
VPPQRADLARRRAERVRRGVNLSHWFAQVFNRAGYTKAHFDAYLTGRDADLIARMGFDHVRFTVEPAPMFDPEAPERLPADYLKLVDGAIEMMLARGLAVVVDVHPSDEFKKKFETDDAHVEAFCRFWRAFAAHLSRYDPERVILEALNEPTVTDRYRWMGVQAKLARAIREGAPRHTIVATGANWSAPDELEFLEPLADRNVIYTFHFYEPHTYTHQGATWGSPYWKFLTRVPYPSSPEAVAPILPSVDDDTANEALLRYGRQRWNAARIAEAIGAAAAWGRSRGVPLYCGEFGVYRKHALPEERAAYLRDVRTALERHRVGWAMWDYAGGFAVANRGAGGPTPDATTVEALGLRARSVVRRP